MQLKNTVIRNKLALASSALLLAAPATPAIAVEESHHMLNNSDVGISQLKYAEKDRLTVDKLQALVNKEITESDIVSVNLVYDSISGSSPNGRIYSVEGEVYTPKDGGTRTSPSGGAGSSAWKTSFKDIRKSINAEWEHRFLPTFSSVMNLGTSTENDYRSYSFSTKLSLEINQRRTTLIAGAAVSNDTVSPIGGVPTGASERTCNAESARFLPDWTDLNCDSKATTFKPSNKVSNDYLIGITQVWNKRTIMQLNFSFSSENGYLTDPYKQVSVYDSESASEVVILYENRPDARQRKSLYYKVVHLPTDFIALHFSYRYYWDDWNLSADTVDGRARINLGSHIYLQAHGRLHWQSAASFFQPYIGADTGARYYAESRPVYISADSRLSEFLATTIGVKLGIIINKKNSLSFRFEEMTQEYKNNLLPTMKTIIMQVNINHKF